MVTAFERLKNSQTKETNSVSASQSAFDRLKTSASKEVQKPQGRQGATGLQGVAVGLAQAEGDVLKGASALGRGITNQTVGRVKNLVTGKGFTPTDVQDFTTNPKFQEALQPKSTAETVGKVGGTIASFLVPAGEINAATKGLSLVPRVLARGAADAGISYLTSGGDAKTAGATGITTGAVESVIPYANKIKGLSTASKVVKQLLPGYAADVSSGLTGLRGEDRKGPNALIPGLGTGISALLGSPKAIKAMTDHIRTTNADAIAEHINEQLGLRGKKLGKLDARGIDPGKVIAENAGSKIPTEGNKLQVDDLINTLDESAKPGYEVRREAIARNNKVEPFANQEQRMYQELDNSRLNALERQQAKAEMPEIIAELKQANGVGEHIDTVTTEKIKEQTGKASRYDLSNPKSTPPRRNALQAINRATRKTIEDAIPDAGIQKLNKALGEIEETISVLDTKRNVNAQNKGGFFGRLARPVIGAIVGSKGGPLGSIVGASVANPIVEVLAELPSSIRSTMLKKAVAEGNNPLATLIKQAEKASIEQSAKQASLPRLNAPSYLEGQPFKGTNRESIVVGGDVPPKSYDEAVQRKYNPSVSSDTLPPQAQSVLPQLKQSLPEKLPQTPQSVNLTGTPISDEIKTIYKNTGSTPIPGFTKFDETVADIYQELSTSKPGSRYFTPDGQVGSSKSTFPKWVPEGLRSNKLFEQVKPYISDIDNLKIPPKSKPKLRTLFNIILDRVEERLGIDASQQRLDIEAPLTQVDVLEQNVDQYNRKFNR